jgi:hypothetical protein
MTGLYNRDEVCLLRGTDWSFKLNLGQSESLKGLSFIRGLGDVKIISA